MDTKHKIMHVVKSMVRCLPFYLFAFLLLTACSEEDVTDTEYANWQARNTAYWDRLYVQAQDSIAAGSANWKIIKGWSLEDSLKTATTSYIVVNVLRQGTGSGCPLYTDSVRVHYTGRLIPSASYPGGYQFDSSFGNATSEATAMPAKFYVGSLVDGFATAVQHMHIGDRWRVYIPAELGYKATAQTSIPAYSTLVFDISLVGYYHMGVKVPDYK